MANLLVPSTSNLRQMVSILSILAASALADSQFLNPPDRYRPETWFHFIGGNIGKEGITADLEALRAAGISGIQLFNGQFGGPWPGVPQVPCLSPEWDAMIGHTSTEAARLGLQFTMQNCPGWATAGGPWVKKSEAMRHLVVNQVRLSGSMPVKVPALGGDDYRDVAVLAFPTPSGEDHLSPIRVEPLGETKIWEAFLAKRGSAELPIGKSSLVYSFASPTLLRGIVLPPVARMTHGQEFDPKIQVQIEALQNGLFRTVATREVPRTNWQDNRPLTLAFPDVRSESFRITFHLQRSIVLDSLEIIGGARTDAWEGKAGYTLRALDPEGIINRPKSACVDPSQIVDLTERLQPDGTLNWTLPKGMWTVMRFGHVYTGTKNGPAPDEATGPEVDKFDPAAVRRHFDSYIGRLSRPTGPAGPRLNGMLLDSWECGSQTWTPKMEQEYGKRRGYALRRWLPALAGYLVRDADSSEKFLRDWRLTLSDLVTDNFYGEVARVAKARKIQTSFETAMGDVMTGDILRYMSLPDTPMCEFWFPDCPQRGGDETKPIAVTASAAHIYGKQKIAAEALTSVNLGYDEHFFTWKPFVDRAFTQGVNHIVFHTYTHNPRLDVVPGTSFGAGIGSPFLRGQTWWNQMPSFTDMIARCESLLQQGQPVADVLWFLGDEVDHKPRQDTPFPSGYRFDYVNADALQNRITAKNGLLQTPEGTRWQVLWLRDYRRATPESLRAIRRCLEAGVPVVGAPPERFASLSGGSNASKEARELIREIWGVKPGAKGQRKVGKGTVLWGSELRAALGSLGIQRDVVAPDELRWCHRTAPKNDVYFLAAPAEGGIHGPVEFRATGNVQMLDPVTGETWSAPLVRSLGDRTRVWIDLDPGHSVFVRFRPGKGHDELSRISWNGKSLVDLVTPPTHRGTTIVSARYGAPGTSLQVDVTDLVRKAVAAGKPVFASNSLAGDPALNRVKVLTVTIRDSEGERTIEVPEGGRASWSQGIRELAPVTVGRDGQLVVWANGTVSTTGGIKNMQVASTGVEVLDGKWTLDLPLATGAKRIKLAGPIPWSSLPEPDVRWFSGTGTYSTTFSLPALGKDKRVLLDLGGVDTMAVVELNGTKFPLSWVPPHRVDVTRALRAGANELKIAVTNTWRNRLAYDASLPESQRQTWTISGPGPSRTPATAGLGSLCLLRIGQVVKLAR